jgi:hypothetical protein
MGEKGHRRASAAARADQAPGGAKKLNHLYPLEVQLDISIHN